jgi:hypothetical protein
MHRLIRYSRACGSCHDFPDRGLLLTRNLMTQVFLVLKLMPSLGMFYDCHHDLVTPPVTEYLCHKWPWICSICRNHNPVLSSFMTYHRVCNKSNTTGTTCGTGTAYPSRAPEFIVGCSGVCVTRYLVVCVMCCRSLFVHYSFKHCVVCPLSICGFWLPL